MRSCRDLDLRFTPAQPTARLECWVGLTEHYLTTLHRNMPAATVASRH